MGHVHVIILVKICECKYCRPHSQCNVHILCTFAFRLTAKFIWPTYFSCSLFFHFLRGRPCVGWEHTQRRGQRQQQRWQQSLLLRVTVIFPQFKQKTFNYILSHDAQKASNNQISYANCWQPALAGPKWANLMANKFQSKTLSRRRSLQTKVKIFA